VIGPGGAATIGGVRPSILGVALVALGGCVEPHEPAAVDAGPLASESGVAPPDCRPEGAGRDRSCPEGCRSWDGAYVDPVAGCATDTRVVILCMPADAAAGHNGAPGCFRRVDDPTDRVYSGTTAILWGDDDRDRFADQGWVLCDELYPARCE